MGNNTAPPNGNRRNSSNTNKLVCLARTDAEKCRRLLYGQNRCVHRYLHQSQKCRKYTKQGNVTCYMLQKLQGGNTSPLLAQNRFFPREKAQKIAVSSIRDTSQPQKAVDASLSVISTDAGAQPVEKPCGRRFYHRHPIRPAVPILEAGAGGPLWRPPGRRLMREKRESRIYDKLILALESRNINR